MAIDRARAGELIEQSYFEIDQIGISDRLKTSIQKDIIKHKREMKKYGQRVIDLKIERDNVQIKIDNLDWDFDNGKLD